MTPPGRIPTSRWPVAVPTLRKVWTIPRGTKREAPNRRQVKEEEAPLSRRGGGWAFTGTFFGKIRLGSRWRNITNDIFSSGFTSGFTNNFPKKPTPENRGLAIDSNKIKQAH